MIPADEETELRRIILAIKNHVRDFVGTTSTHVDEMENVLNGYVMSAELEALILGMEGGRLKRKQQRKSKTKKTKKSNKVKKSKKSRRHRSK